MTHFSAHRKAPKCVIPGDLASPYLESPESPEPGKPEDGGLTRPGDASGVSQRIREILDRYDDGNVTAAARRLGVSPRGLAKVYNGQTVAPRVDLLLVIAREYPVDPTWLLTGHGSPEWAHSDERVKQEAERLLLEVLERLREGRKG